MSGGDPNFNQSPCISLQTIYAPKISIRKLKWRRQCTSTKTNHSLSLSNIRVNNQLSYQSGFNISSWSLNGKRSQFGHSGQLQRSLYINSRSNNIINKCLYIILECYHLYKIMISSIYDTIIRFYQVYLVFILGHLWNIPLFNILIAIILPTSNTCIFTFISQNFTYNLQKYVPLSPLFTPPSPLSFFALSFSYLSMFPLFTLSPLPLPVPSLHSQQRRSRKLPPSSSYT